MIDASSRHPSVQAVVKYFGYEHLPVQVSGVSRRCHDLAVAMLADIPDSPELVVGLRKLLEAKDAFVRARL